MAKKKVKSATEKKSTVLINKKELSPRQFGIVQDLLKKFKDGRVRRGEMAKFNLEKYGKKGSFGFISKNVAAKTSEKGVYNLKVFRPADTGEVRHGRPPGTRKAAGKKASKKASKKPAAKQSKSRKTAQKGSKAAKKKS